VLILGGPTDTFLEHFSTDNLIEDLVLLHARLINLGVRHSNGTAYLVDLDESIDRP